MGVPLCGRDSHYGNEMCAGYHACMHGGGGGGGGGEMKAFPSTRLLPISASDPSQKQAVEDICMDFDSVIRRLPHCQPRIPHVT